MENIFVIFQSGKIWTEVVFAPLVWKQNNFPDLIFRRTFS